MAQNEHEIEEITIVSFDDTAVVWNKLNEVLQAVGRIIAEFAEKIQAIIASIRPTVETEPEFYKNPPRQQYKMIYYKADFTKPKMYQYRRTN